MRPSSGIGHLFIALATLATASPMSGCSSQTQPATSRTAQAGQPPECKRTRNMQAAGPQQPATPPRCADSFDAGKLPASALPPIILP